MWFKKLLKGNRLYMDFASSTPVHRQVLRAMNKAARVYGNPSSPHAEGHEAHTLLEQARTSVARSLSVKSESIFFTGSGTESNNLAVNGVIEALVERGATYNELHIITSVFEHPSLLEPVRGLEKRGVAVSYITPTEDGIVTPEMIQKCIRKETVLVSLVAVQSEIGMIQPLKAISRMLNNVREKNIQSAQKYAPECQFPIFHSDASQSALFVDLSPQYLGVDMATYDAQKIMGPKGVGVFYKHSSVSLAPFIRGGSQERKLRPGTPNVAGAVGMARALEIAVKNRKENATRVEKVRNYALELIQNELPQVTINGGVKNRIANNINISVPGADGDYLAVLMSNSGIAVSPRSACIAAGSVSHAVTALGKGEDEAHGTLRFSFAPWVSRRDARCAITALAKAIAVVDSI